MGYIISFLSIIVAGQNPSPATSPLPLPADTTPKPAVVSSVLDPEVRAWSPLGTIPSETDSARRNLFESDHAFDGFTGPFSNAVQAKDPRSLTEARLVFLENWSAPGTPVVGAGDAQLYALQLRLALTDRLQVFADKDGIVRLSPQGGSSVTGLANLAAGVKYAFIRDVENQFIGSFVLQYEAPTGYANIFQGQGGGLLGAYAVFGKEFWDHYHALIQFGQNASMNVQNSGYFMTSAHLDRRFGRFTPFYEANWFYYNQNGNYLPTLGIEGGGLLNLGAGNVVGLSYVTNCVGFKYDLTKHAELGVGYEFQVSQPRMLFSNMLGAQVILRY